MKVPTPKVITDLVLEAEMERRTTQYNILMQSIRTYLAEEQAAKEALLTDREHVELEQKQFQKCIDMNELFNKRSSEIRQLRETALRKEEEEKNLELLMQMEQDEQVKLESARKEVLKAIHGSKEIITSETLQLSIEQALNRRQLYNFAIDLEGRRHLEQSDGSCVVLDPRETDTPRDQLTHHVTTDTPRDGHTT